ncbi:heterokaryon incompatibility protein-domain-containing protein [Bisporella sp. PMI_857]|nr:heterokaryon incompatibility protein-domain-containing protein [Bisporella sp. PMI_857]
MAMRAIYKSSLGEDGIRLITLLPGLDRAPVVCELATFESHEEALPYEALSYTWGDPSVTAPIILNHQKFRVTVNLQHALQDLRYPNRPRTLWIDAVCINQKDVPERSEHVSQMGRIYASAANVVVWLGLGTADSDTALDFMNEIGGSFGPNNTLPSHFLHPKQTPKWFSFFRLFNRPWFSRRWIIQEISLARTAILCCSNRAVPWRFLNLVLMFHQSCAKEISGSRNEYCQLLDVPDALVEEGLTHLPAIKLRIAAEFVRACLPQKPNPAEALVTMMLNSGDFKSMDPRDAIYAFLSLAGDKKSLQGFHADYSKSELEIFKEFVEFFINSTSALDIIYFEWAPEIDAAKNTLPSWMLRPVNVGASLGKKQFLTVGSSSFCTIEPGHLSLRYYFSASRDSLPRMRISTIHQSAFVLSATGFQIGEITQVGQIPQSHVSIPRSWVSMAQECARSKFHQDTHIEEGLVELWQTITGNRNFMGYPIDFPDQWSKLFRQLVEESGSNDLSIFDSPDVYRRFGLPEGTGVRNLDNFFVRAQQTMIARTLFVSADGNLGMGPVGIRGGDVVAILLGCHVPVILRPEDGHYIMVGECYLHGDGKEGPIMTGGAMAFPEEGYTQFIIH